MGSIRTDLAMESFEEHSKERLPGVEISSWEAEGVHVTEVKVSQGEGARLLGKAPGSYLTLELEDQARRAPESRRAMATLLGEELARLVPPGESDPVLVLGLGNRWVTPDALGPRTVERTLVTRHILREMPQAADERMGLVCAVAPGVLGVTGVETQEMVKGLISQLRPRCVIAVDALAARATDRMGYTIQLTDTGIQPGSGVGNHRSALTQETLGVKVLALGVPTVVYAATVARDALELLARNSGLEQGHEKALDALGDQIAGGELGEMIVTPREIDQLIEDVSAMLASGINQALHPGLSQSEIDTMM